jgi:hypothetical protein
MPVVLFDQGSTFHVKWAAQFVAADPLNRLSIPMVGAATPSQIRDVIKQAARHPTGDSEIIFAVGHGGSLGMTEGTVDLAPQKKFRLARGNKPPTFVDPFYDWVFSHPGLQPISDKSNDEKWVAQNAPERPGASERLARWAIYKEIGAAIAQGNIYRVTFLTCNIGNATDFIKKISIDWNVLIKAYTRFVVFQVVPATNTVRAFLEGDAPGSGTNITLGETQLPQTSFVTVGPPLP